MVGLAGIGGRTVKPRRKPELSVIGTGTRKRVTLIMSASLYAQLENLAAEQHRDLQGQCLHSLEVEVNRNQARKDTAKRERQRRAASDRWQREVEDLIRGDGK